MDFRFPRRIFGFPPTSGIPPGHPDQQPGKLPLSMAILSPGGLIHGIMDNMVTAAKHSLAYETEEPEIILVIGVEAFGRLMLETTFESYCLLSPAEQQLFDELYEAWLEV